MLYPWGFDKLMKTKGQSISITMIVLVVMALLVLVVIITLLSGRLGIFSQETQGCIQQGGVCANQCGQGYAQDAPIRIAGACPGTTQVCCIG